MSQILQFTVEAQGDRLDKFVSQSCGISRSYAQKLIEEGKVAVNSRPQKASLKLSPGDQVRVDLPLPAATGLVPEDIPLNIVYEDDDLLVIDKPAGLTVHPAPGHQSHTLVNAIVAHCPDLAGIKGSLRPGIVHRLDRDTSGLMLVAKNDKAHQNLASQIKNRTIVKAYLALVVGRLVPEQGAIEAPIGRDPSHRQRMAVVTGGREAQTSYRVLRYLDNHTLLEVMPRTGRTHQIRVHLAAIGRPVFGDPVYGNRSPLLTRQFLHSWRLGFRLPSSGEYVEFKSELPADLSRVLDLLSS